MEGICLVATPALIRDFSPQVGRATAMGFWTSGPVIGSLIVSVVGSATIPAVVNDDAVLDPRVPHLRHRRPGRVRDRAGRAQGTVPAAARPADGDHARPRADRGQGQGPDRRGHRGGAAPPVPPAAQDRRHRLLHRGVDHAADLLHRGRVQRDLPDHRVRPHAQGRQRPGQLELGLQRPRGDPGRDHLRPVPGPQAVHGDRRRAGRGDDRDLPGCRRATIPATTRWRSCWPCCRSAWASPTPRGWPASPRPWRPATRRSSPPAWPSGAGSSGSWSSSRTCASRW